MKILVTGSSGFVGQNLVPYLTEHGFHDILTPDLRKEDINLEGVDVIIHLAGKAHDLKHAADDDVYFNVNYGLTKKLYDAYLLSNASQFLFVSSVKASADTVKNILKEDDLPKPETIYGKSKLKAEEYIQSQPLPSGKSYNIFRPCMIHGPGNKGNLNLLYKLVAKGYPYPFAGFENKRSFLSVENLCFILLEVVQRKNLPNGIYQVADDKSLSTNEVIKIIASESGKKAKLWRIPAKLIIMTAKIGNILKLPLNTERLTKLTENYIVDNTKIKDWLKKDLPLTSVAGMRKTIENFKKS